MKKRSLVPWIGPLGHVDRAAWRPATELTGSEPRSALKGRSGLQQLKCSLEDQLRNVMMDPPFGSGNVWTQEAKLFGSTDERLHRWGVIGILGCSYRTPLCWWTCSVKILVP